MWVLWVVRLVLSVVMLFFPWGIPPAVCGQAGPRPSIALVGVLVVCAVIIGLLGVEGFEALD